MNKKGFTLAEILITLGIIGVVAALTIPIMVQNITEEKYKTAAKKTYSTLYQASVQAKEDNGGDLASADYKSLYAKQLKYIKSCSNSSAEGCWHKAGSTYAWTRLDGNTGCKAGNCPGENDAYSSGFVLNDGSMITFWYNSGHSGGTCPTLVNSWYSYGIPGYYCSEMSFDTNGFQGPNVIGKDIFEVIITKDRLLQVWPVTATSTIKNGGFTKLAEYLSK